MDKGKAVRQRLMKLEKAVGGRTITDIAHAWDRLPKYSNGNPKMDHMYEEALASLRGLSVKRKWRLKGLDSDEQITAKSPNCTGAKTHAYAD